MIDRRAFLQRAQLVAGAALCGALPIAGCAARMRYVVPRTLGDRLAVEQATVPAAGLLVEDPRTDLPIFLRPAPNGEYTAVSTRCMHRGCQVEPTPDRLVCPCHGSEYTFAGAVLQGPTQHPLVHYVVTVEADTLFIHAATPGAL